MIGYGLWVIGYGLQVTGINGACGAPFVVLISPKGPKMGQKRRKTQIYLHI